MFHKIKSLSTLPEFILLVGFQDGTFREFDLKSLMDKYPPFESLKQVQGLYENAKIDIGGYGIVWNDELDISAECIYEQGKPCSPPSGIE